MTVGRLLDADSWCRNERYEAGIDGQVLISRSQGHWFAASGCGISIAVHGGVRTGELRGDGEAVRYIESDREGSGIDDEAKVSVLVGVGDIDKFAGLIKEGDGHVRNSGLTRVVDAVGVLVEEDLVAEVCADWHRKERTSSGEVVLANVEIRARSNEGVDTKVESAVATGQRREVADRELEIRVLCVWRFGRNCSGVVRERCAKGRHHEGYEVQARCELVDRESGDIQPLWHACDDVAAAVLIDIKDHNDELGAAKVWLIGTVESNVDPLLSPR